MTLLPIVLLSAVILSIAYFTYGRLLARLLKLDPTKPTPAVELRDGLDYEPIDSKFLMSQHFSAIAAAGPIVGPIAAGLAFGWLPALIWILVGSILIGGVHDMTALTASIRHNAGSIAEVVRKHISQRSFLLFLSFVWIALVYIIVAFTDVTTAAFVGRQDLGGGVVVHGGAVATSSLLYLVLPIVMGLLLRFTKLSLNWATLIFLPLIAATIYVGPYIPFDIEQIFGLQKAAAQDVWDVALLIYCLVAAVVPVWLLLQPRGHLGGYFLYIALGGGAIGLVLGGHKVEYPQFIGWMSARGDTLFPFLFITIACGACSGFHSLIASGTTSKQLKHETDARPIGYGAMLLEAMVAIVSLSCVMIWAQGSPTLNSTPNVIYAQGMGEFLRTLHIPPQFAISFALMAFTTFVYDTLDVCTRLGRYIIQELTGWKDAKGKWLGTGLTSGVPLYFLLQAPPVDAKGVPQPLYKLFWNLFGASNQLLAALTLLGVTIWLWRTRREAWVWLVTGVPCVFMYVMSSWALIAMTWPKFVNKETGGYQVPTDPVPWIGIVLLVLAALMLVEAFIALRGDRRPPARGLSLPAVPAAG
ncbi:MAG: carbon starvation protein A [Planctomycetia bacterium]|nr:carbon starvation protein A [Planctomycetia bacterium]